MDCEIMMGHIQNDNITGLPDMYHTKMRQGLHIPLTPQLCSILDRCVLLRFARIGSGLQLQEKI